MYVRTYVSWAHSWCSSSSQRCVVELRSGVCAGQSSSCIACMEAVSCWNRIGASPNCCHQVKGTLLSKIYLYASSIVKKGASPNHENSSRLTRCELGCPHTFGHIIYLSVYLQYLSPPSDLVFLPLNLTPLSTLPPALSLCLSLSEQCDWVGRGAGRPAAWRMETEVNWIVIRAEVINW